MRNTVLSAVAIWLVSTGAIAAPSDPAFPSADAARLHAAFDLPQAGELAGRGRLSVRFFVDGAFSGLLPAVVLDREAGAYRLSFVTLPGSGDPRERRSVALPAAEGEALAAEAKAALVQVARPPPPAPATGVIVVCADGSLTDLEIIAEGRAERVAELTCGADEVLGDLAEKAAARLVAGLPECDALPASGIYGSFSRLQTCSLARGDRAAASQVIRTLLARDESGGPTFFLLASDGARLEWPGRPAVVGGAAVRRAWADLSNDPGARFGARRVIGHGTAHVTVEGGVSYLAHPGDADYQYAPSTQDWRRIGGRWRLTRWRVGAFHAVRPAIDPRGFT